MPKRSYVEFYMYAVIVFALVLLSPMPFVSPFGHIVQDVAAQSPFGPFLQEPLVIRYLPSNDVQSLHHKRLNVFEISTSLGFIPSFYKMYMHEIY